MSGVGSFFSHGPHLGVTTKDSLKIWGRFASQGDAVFVARLFRKGELIDFREVDVQKSLDFTFNVVFTGLAAGETYEFQGSFKEIESELFSFNTESDSKGLHFVFSSCRYNHWENFVQNDGPRGDQTYKAILDLHKKESLDALFLLGDQIYADPTLMVGVSQSFEDFTSTYQEAFRFKWFQELLRHVPTTMILDDHEIRNEWSCDLLYENTILENRDLMYKNGILAYECWQHGRNPQTRDEQYWYTLEKKGFPFFVMDVRTRRWHNPEKGLRKTTLGDEQLSELFEWLDSTKGQPVRFIASGVPFFPDTISGVERWDAFDEERSMILEFLRLEKIGKTVFISGDVHLGVFSKLHCVQDDSVEVFNFVSSPLFWPYPGMRTSDFYHEKTLTYNQYADLSKRRLQQYDYAYETGDWLTENQFCEMKVNADGEGVARHFNMKTNAFEAPWYF
ncbi:MAG: alkaline phosphatase family protein [Lentisphaeraceae bacterium]|nr:alkaline phosphatase family protein [Lentisphaeraceae bacterium]